MANELSFARFDCESEFDRTARDFEFAYALMEQNREMERFVNESLILASGNKRAINEMTTIIHESAFTDKIKAFFTKIKNFFKKIFDKLGASMNALFGEQKKYMEQYANLIMNCKYNAGDVSDVKDHFKGLPRIIDAADNTEQAVIGTNMDKYFNQNVIGNNENADSFININVFDSAQSINTAPIPKKKDINSEIKLEAFNEFTKQGYWSNKSSDGFTTKNDNNNNIDIDGTFRAYFDGSEDTVSWSGDEIDKNFQVIINATYGGVTYMNKLEKLVNTITKKMDDAEKKMDDYVKSQQDKIKKAVANQGSNTNNEPGSANVKITKDQITNAATNAKYDTQGNAKVNIGGKTYEFSGGTTGQSVPLADLENKVKADGVTVESVVFTEIQQVPTNSSSNDNSKDAARMSSGGSGSDNAQKVSDANTKASNMTANTQQAITIKNTTGITDSNKNTVEDKANQLLDADIHNRQNRVNADLQISSSIVRSMFNAFQLLNKDFFSIIKFHVQWYLSNPGAEKDAANKATRKMDRNMNASGAQMKQPGTPSQKPAPAPEEGGTG